MEIHPSFYTDFLGKLLNKDLFLLDHVVAAGIAFIFLLSLAIAVKGSIKLIPGHLQQLVEVVVEGLLSLLGDNLGERSRQYLPLIGTLAFFIFISNFMGMIPTFSAATGNFNTTVACAVIVFLYYNWQGLKEHGIAYVKHFMGPVSWMAPLMFPIEIISHLARPFSLAIRLFGNISGEHAVTLTFYSLVAWLLPVPLMAFGLFAAFLQTFVFILLSTLYIQGAISHDH